MNKDLDNESERSVGSAAGHFQSNGSINRPRIGNRLVNGFDQWTYAAKDASHLIKSLARTPMKMEANHPPALVDAPFWADRPSYTFNNIWTS